MLREMYLYSGMRCEHAFLYIILARLLQSCNRDMDFHSCSMSFFRCLNRHNNFRLHHRQCQCCAAFKTWLLTIVSKHICVDCSACFGRSLELSFDHWRLVYVDCKRYGDSSSFNIWGGQFVVQNSVFLMQRFELLCS